MGLWDKMREPVFLKESNEAQRQIQMLEGLAPCLTIEGQEILRQDIRCLEYGILGEQQIAYELKNSHMPMYILHDIYLEDGDLSAQIDYLVVTRKLCFVIECKNLYGNIEITPTGEFYRIMEFNGQRKKEAIYSPVTQNEHHLELLKKIRLEGKENFLFRRMAEKQFDRTYQSIVVLSNPKTLLYAQNSSPYIRERVIRADQLVAYIRKQYQISSEAELSDKKLKEWAESFLDLHQEKHKNYLRKYQDYWVEEARLALSRKKVVSQPVSSGRPQAVSQPVSPSRSKIVRLPVSPSASGGEIKIEDTPLFKALRSYRWKKSQEEGIKPYFIYNDSQLKDLIARMPNTKRELMQVSGFGKAKAEKYGAEILEIIRRFR